MQRGYIKLIKSCNKYFNIVTWKAEIQLHVTGRNYILKYIKTKNCYFKL